MMLSKIRNKLMGVKDDARLFFFEYFKVVAVKFSERMNDGEESQVLESAETRFVSKKRG